MPALSSSVLADPGRFDRLDVVETNHFLIYTFSHTHSHAGSANLLHLYLQLLHSLMKLKSDLHCSRTRLRKPKKGATKLCSLNLMSNLRQHLAMFCQYCKACLICLNAVRFRRFKWFEVRRSKGFKGLKVLKVFLFSVVFLHSSLQFKVHNQ